MKISRVWVENHPRIADLNIEVRDHVVFVGANDVGKTSLLRLLNLLLGSSTAALYQAFSAADITDPEKPLVVQVEFTGLDAQEWTVFPNETTVSPDDHGASLTLRMEVSVDPADPDAVLVKRWFPDSGTDRAMTREQLLSLGWRYLPSSRTASSAQLDGSSGALQVLLAGVDLGPEQASLRGLLTKFNENLQISEPLGNLREKIAGHLSQAMPTLVGKDDLLVRTANDPEESILRDVSMFIARAGRYAPMSEQSDGIRQLMLITLFDLAEDAAHFIGIDEPELHLHSSSQRTIAELLKSVGRQKIVVTHSPYIAQRFDPAEVVVISHDRACHQIPTQKRSAIENVLAHWWSPRLLEVLTARYVIVVEGLADRIVLEAAAKAIGLELDRLGIVVLEIDGADKFPNVYKLIGKDGFCVPTYGMVDKNEKGKWLGAFGGKPKHVEGEHVWVCQPDLEAEYSQGIGGPEIAALLVASGVQREQGLLQACSVSNVSDITPEMAAAACRNNKIASAVAIAGALTGEQVGRISSLNGLLQKLKSVTA